MRWNVSEYPIQLIGLGKVPTVSERASHCDDSGADFERQTKEF